MKTHTIKWIVTGAVGAGMLAFSVSANAAGTSTGAVAQPVTSQYLQLAAEDCGGVIKASAMKDDKMADDKMAKDVAMKDDKMAKDAMKDDKMADDKMAKDDMKTDVMAKVGDCAKKDTM